MGNELWSGQAQNGVNSDFEVEFDLEGQGLLHLWSKFGDPSGNGSRVITRTSKWLTHRQTDTHTRTQATTVPKGQNWPRVKSMNPDPKSSILSLFINRLLLSSTTYSNTTHPFHKMLGHINCTNQPLSHRWDQGAMVLHPHTLYLWSHTYLSLSCDRRESGTRGILYGTSRDGIW